MIYLTEDYIVWSPNTSLEAGCMDELLQAWMSSYPLILLWLCINGVSDRGGGKKEEGKEREKEG